MVKDADGKAFGTLTRNTCRYECQDAGNMIDELTALFAGPGAGEYLGEPVTIAQHMLQAGALAEAAGAAPALIAAALLHGVGHLLSQGTHNDIGAAWLSRWFGREVTEPVRLPGR